MDSSFTQLKQNLIDVLFLIQSLNQGQVIGLSQFVTPSCPVNLNDPMQINPQTMTIEEMERMIKIACNLEQNEKLLQRTDVIQFTQLYHLLVLQIMLRDMSIVQLYKFFDITAGRQLHEQLQIFQVLQELFAKTDGETLSNLHAEFNEILNRQGQQLGGGSDVDQMELPRLLGQCITSHLQLSPDLFYMYEPLRFLLQLPLEEVEHFQSYFPTWDHTRLRLLVRLIDVGNVNLGDVHDIICLLVPNKMNGLESINLPTNNCDDACTDGNPVMNYCGGQQQPSLFLEIAEQPPEKCVYKRNVKPHPTIFLSGDMSLNDGCMYIQPLLIRCDTHEEVNNLLDGAQRVKITSGRTVIFKRLKILSTSHQLNETLFSLKFELRRYPTDNQEKYEVIHSVTTVPICVVSHSTQLKTNVKALPVVTEVIPLSGPPSGATRVVILGSNFIESPTTLVKFDNVEVKPYFHGPKTLICHTPKHPPGTVSVKVCNDLGRWSETEASYTYDGTSLTTEEEEEPVQVSQEFDINCVLPYLQNCSQSSSLDIFSQFNNNFGADIHGFSPLHYCAAFGLLEVLMLLLSGGADPCLPDKFGNTPLFWAVINANLSVVRVLMMNGGLKRMNLFGDTPLHLAAKFGHLDVLNELIVNGAIIDVQNNEGLTPLHYAVMGGDPLIVKELLKRGARADLVTLDGCTSIHLSTLISSPEILQVLADQSKHYLYSQDEFGDTVVHWAVRQNDESLLKVLVKLDAPFNTSNFDYESPMGLALSLNHLNLIPLLKSVMIPTTSSPNMKKTRGIDIDRFLPTKPFKQQRVQDKSSLLDRIRPGTSASGDPQRKAPSQSPNNSGSSSMCNDMCVQECESVKSTCYYWSSLTGEDNLSTASNWDSLAIG